MCLVNVKRDDDDIVIAPRRAPRRSVVWTDGSGSRQRVSERIVTTTTSPPPRVITYPGAPSPRTSGALVRNVTPPRRVITPAERERIELVTVDVAETRHSRAGSANASPRGSKVSVRSRSRHGGSRGGTEEVYIERERERVRLPVVKHEAYDTYQYVEAPVDRRRSRSITYETSPRASGRVVERERVVVEDGGRRREYYRKP